jgi:hypothetical protein
VSVENDSIRSAGDLTLVDVWVDGKLRSISISRQAIAKLRQLPADQVEAQSDDDSREFVRTRLALIAGAAKERLRSLDPDAEMIAITADDVGAADQPFVERRKGERRKSNRRTPAQPGGKIGDRRQGDRRKGDRRKGSHPAPDGDPLN